MGALSKGLAAAALGGVMVMTAACGSRGIAEEDMDDVRLVKAFYDCLHTTGPFPAEDVARVQGEAQAMINTGYYRLKPGQTKQDLVAEMSQALLLEDTCVEKTANSVKPGIVSVGNYMVWVNSLISKYGEEEVSKAVGRPYP